MTTIALNLNTASTSDRTTGRKAEPRKQELPASSREIVAEDSPGFVAGLFQDSSENISTGFKAATSLVKLFSGAVTMVLSFTLTYFLKDKTGLDLLFKLLGAGGLGLTGWGVWDIVKAFGKKNQAQSQSIESQPRLEKPSNHGEIKNAENKVFLIDHDFVKDSLPDGGKVRSNNFNAALTEDVGLLTNAGALLTAYTSEDSASILNLANSNVGKDELVFTDVSPHKALSLNEIKDRNANLIGYILGAVTPSPSATRIIANNVLAKLNSADKTISQKFEKILPNDFVNVYRLGKTYWDVLGEDTKLNPLLTKEKGPRDTGPDGPIEVVKKLFATNRAERSNPDDVRKYIANLQNAQNGLTILKQVLEHVTDENPNRSNDFDSQRSRNILRQALIAGLKVQGKDSEAINQELVRTLEGTNLDRGVNERLKAVTEQLNRVIQILQDKGYPFTQVSESFDLNGALKGLTINKIYRATV